MPSRINFSRLKRALIQVSRFSARALSLSWAANPTLTALIGTLTIVQGVLPAATAFISAKIIDAVARAWRQSARLDEVIAWVAIEAACVATTLLSARVAVTNSL